MQAFRGTVLSVAALVASAAVALYLLHTFWWGNVLDFGWVVKSRPIPAESYPIILLTIWSVLQRAKAHWRPHGGASGRFWAGEDLVESAAMALFIVVTFVWALATGTNTTFVIVLLAFLVQSVFDLLMNGRHRYEAETGTGAPAATGGDAPASSSTHEIQLDVRVQPRVMPTRYE